MKILHITPDIYEGGVATLVYEMSRYQVSRNHSVTIFCTVTSKNQKSRESYFTDIGVEVVYCHYKNPYDPRIIFAVRRLLKDYDLIHVHLFPNQFFVRIANLFASKTKRFLITTEHNTWNNRRKHAILRFFDRWLYNGYDKIVCISNPTEFNLRKWLGGKYRTSEKIRTITNGVNLKKYSLFDDIHKEDKIIIMVSRLENPKDPLTLVKAISKCDSDVKVIFVGSGPMEKDIRVEAKKLEIEHRVHLLGNRTDVPELLAKASIGVLSTNWDGFGLVAVEYMAAGLPVLASNVDGLRDVVGDNESLFPVGDENTLSAKIISLLQDKSFYIEKSRYFKNRSLLFSIEKMNKEYLDLYQNIFLQIPD